MSWLGFRNHEHSSSTLRAVYCPSYHLSVRCVPFRKVDSAAGPPWAWEGAHRKIGALPFVHNFVLWLNSARTAEGSDVSYHWVKYRYMQGLLSPGWRKKPSTWHTAGDMAMFPGGKSAQWNKQKSAVIQHSVTEQQHLWATQWLYGDIDLSWPWDGRAEAVLRLLPLWLFSLSHWV